MAYSNGKLHPCDPGLGALSRPEGQSIEEAEIERLRRRQRAIKRRLAELEAKARDGDEDQADI